MNVGVVDIGTNSMRLLITSAEEEVGRWVEVTGLGRGVDQTGHLDVEAMARSLDVFQTFADLMAAHDVVKRTAIATSASRDAANREEFFDQAEEVLGVRPTLISGESEARYAFRGAIGDADAPGVVVSDIGGGSTEFVTAGQTVSIDIGSVRLTDRLLDARPAHSEDLNRARDHVARLFSPVDLGATNAVGVAGTWTSLAAVVQKLDVYDREKVHGYRLGLEDLMATIDYLAALTMEETETIPALDPKRAPVILSGAVVAEAVLRSLRLDEAKISERDTLDGVADELLNLS